MAKSRVYYFLFFFIVYSVMENKKVIAVIAQLIRKSGFKGKLEPHLDESQLLVYSSQYSDIVYSVRMEGSFPNMYVYRLVDGVWKPIRKSGVIVNFYDVLNYEERKEYKDYYEYFSYYKYDKFGPEYSLLSECIDKVIKKIKDYTK